MPTPTLKPDPISALIADRLTIEPETVPSEQTRRLARHITAIIRAKFGDDIDLSQILCGADHIVVRGREHPVEIRSISFETLERPNELEAVVYTKVRNGKDIMVEFEKEVKARMQEVGVVEEGEEVKGEAGGAGGEAGGAIRGEEE